MGLTQEIGKIWNIKLVRRAEINTNWMQQALEVDTETIYPKNRIAAVLHRFIKAGCAKKGGTRSSYKKLKNFKPRRVIPKLGKDGLLDTSFEEKDQQEFPFKEKPIDSIDLLTLGKAWDALTDDLKAQVTELRKQLSEERKTIGELVEQKREIDELYKKAQTRILELNTGGPKGKSVSLSELQSFRDELPK